MRIQNKLFIAFLLAGISLVALMFAAIQWSLTKGLLEFINTKERDTVMPLVQVLEREYNTRGSWQWLADRHRLFHQMFRQHVVNGNPNFSPPPSPSLNSNRRPPSHGEGRARPEPPHRRGQADGPGMRDGPPPHRRDRPPREMRDRPAHELTDRAPPRKRSGPSPRSPGGHRPADLTLFDKDKGFVVGKPDADENDNWLELKVDKQIVGYLVIPLRSGITEGYELTLLEQQRFAYIVISIVLIVLMAVIAMPLATNLVEPIKQLARSMEQLTKGNYKTRLSLERTDELGFLSRDVNELAVTLEKNDTARKRWLANISHELRTPIAVMKSEMEAVIDGIRPLDIEQIESSHQEVQRLQRLVEDLYELSSSDIGGMKYRKEELDIIELLDDDLSHFKQILSSNNMTLSHQLPENELLVWADSDRLGQLFKNIMVNCAKYAASDGVVHLSVEQIDKQVQIRIEDNGPGVPQQHLENLFEHLYRVDDSRNRKTGGSGLGLAICKQIVEAHQGRIHAEKSSLGGLAVVINLPLV